VASALLASLVNASIVPQLIHRNVPGALSIVARYCFAQHARGGFVGYLEDPIALWAAFTNHYIVYNKTGGGIDPSLMNVPPTPIRLLTRTGAITGEVYDSDDPRSHISIEEISSSSRLPILLLDSPLPNHNSSGATELRGTIAIDERTASTSSRQGPLGSLTNPLTIVLHVSGEMGNNLSKLAYGFSIQWMLMEEHNISTDILVRHQAASKWLKAAENVQRCFPATRAWSFEAANTDEYDWRKRQQELWLKESTDYFYFKPTCDQEDCIRKNLDFVIKNLHTTTGKPSIDDNYNISLPFIFFRRVCDS
jgi:hypothetical protein